MIFATFPIPFPERVMILGSQPVKNRLHCMLSAFAVMSVFHNHYNRCESFPQTLMQMQHRVIFDSINAVNRD
jgi:hypothetical protein